MGKKAVKPAAQGQKSTAVRRFPCKPDIDDQVTKAAPDEPGDPLAAPEEVAPLVVDEWDQYRTSDISDARREDVEGSAVARYAPLVENFGRPLLWERAPLVLTRVYSCALKLRLRPVADLIGAVLVGQRKRFELQVQETAWARVREILGQLLGDGDPKRTEAVGGLLAAVLARDSHVMAEMSELQRLPIGRFAAQIRLIALDAAVEWHQFAVALTAMRVDLHVSVVLPEMQAAGVVLAEDSRGKTTRILLRALCKDLDLCGRLANRRDRERIPLDAIDDFVERHLSEMFWRTLRRNGQPIPEDERAAVGAQIFGRIKSNGKR